MAEAMGIGKKYRERRVQLNRPVQCGGKSNITEKNRNIASMCEHLEGCSMLEKGGPRNALLLCARKEDRKRERKAPRSNWISNGNPNQMGAR